MCRPWSIGGGRRSSLLQRRVLVGPAASRAAWRPSRAKPIMGLDSGPLGPHRREKIRTCSREDYWARVNIGVSYLGRLGKLTSRSAFFDVRARVRPGPTALGVETRGSISSDVLSNKPPSLLAASSHGFKSTPRATADARPPAFSSRPSSTSAGRR